MRISDWSSDVCSSDLSTDKVVMFLDEARALGLTVLPPDVNASNFMFEAIDDTTIRYGLGAVKGVGRGACEAIADERGRVGTFDDLLDFCRRIESSQLNRRTLEARVHVGAIDALGGHPAPLRLELPEVRTATRPKVHDTRR